MAIFGMDFSNPSTVNALAMALGTIGKGFAQNPQQAAFADQVSGFAQRQQQNQLLANMLGGGAGGGQAPALSPAVDEAAGYAGSQVAFNEQANPAVGVPAMQAGQPTSPSTMGGQDAGRMAMLAQLLGGGGYSPFL